MGARVLSSAILALFGAALIFFGIGFLAWAIWMGLTPLVGEAWAAAITALLLLLGPIIAFIALGFRRRRTIEERASSLGGASTTLAFVAAMAKDKPLMAVLATGLFAAAEIFLKKRK
jgi:hypothetical protein